MGFQEDFLDKVFTLRIRKPRHPGHINQDPGVKLMPIINKLTIFQTLYNDNNRKRLENIVILNFKLGNTIL